MDSSLRFLVYNGASADCLDWRGWTPLHVTLAHGHLDTARCLVDAGAALDLTTPLGGSSLGGWDCGRTRADGGGWADGGVGGGVRLGRGG